MNDIKVEKFNWQGIGAELVKQCKAKNPSNDYKISHRELGLIRVKGKYILTDKEAIHIILENENEKFGIDIYQEAEGKFYMFPIYSAEVCLADIKEYLTGESVTLKEFMGERYQYNGRIVSNESLLKSSVK